MTKPKSMRLRFAAGGLAALIGTFSLATSVLGASGATSVAGRQVPVESCNGVAEAAASFEMTGNLDGCWYADSFNLTAASPGGVVVVSGLEHFVGCISTKCGTLFFKFVFVGKFDAAGAELSGGCHHPILGGTGDFVGASGELNFEDDPDGSSFPPADYSGRVVTVPGRG